jgi:hypothetical protein
MTPVRRPEKMTLLIYRAEKWKTYFEGCRTLHPQTPEFPSPEPFSWWKGQVKNVCGGAS